MQEVDLTTAFSSMDMFLSAVNQSMAEKAPTLIHHAVIYEYETTTSSSSYVQEGDFFRVQTILNTYADQIEPFWQQLYSQAYDIQQVCCAHEPLSSESIFSFNLPTVQSLSSEGAHSTHEHCPTCNGEMENGVCAHCSSKK